MCWTSEKVSWVRTSHLSAAVFQCLDLFSAQNTFGVIHSRPAQSSLILLIAKLASVLTSQLLTPVVQQEGGCWLSRDSFLLRGCMDFSGGRTVLGKEMQDKQFRKVEQSVPNNLRGKFCEYLRGRIVKRLIQVRYFLLRQLCRN